jgi:hypothetical protein
MDDAGRKSVDDWDAFEAWAAGAYDLDRDDADEYEDFETDAAYDVWQAALAWERSRNVSDGKEPA